MTPTPTWKAVEFLLTKLEPIDLEDLDSSHRVCVICQEELGGSEDDKQSHAPVRTVCGHIFGKRCISKWLDPLRFWGLVDEDRNRDHDEPGQSTCPTCRRVFFGTHMTEPLDFLAGRLSFWDSAYASAGVARSTTEELSRKHLWEYVEYCRSINEQVPCEPARLKIQEALYWMFRHWTKVVLKAQFLTPEQEILRQKLERSLE